MSESAITAKSKKFYERYHFPGNRPIDKDGLIFLKRFSNSVIARSMDDGIESLNILDAGCGTGNTAVSLAKQFKKSNFYAFDNSGASLNKAKSLAEQEGLFNIQFCKWNLLEPLPYTIEFDIIICLGVLHHTANMKKALENLNKVLKQDGQLYLWIYAQTGRFLHSLNSKLLKMLVDADPNVTDELSVATEFITKVGNGSVLNDLVGTSTTYLVQTKVASDPVWIADQFLNPHEQLINMEQLLTLINSSGFDLEDILGIDKDVSKSLNSQLLSEKFDMLDKEQRLIALDLLHKPERYFVILKKKN